VPTKETIEELLKRPISRSVKMLEMRNPNRFSFALSPKEKGWLVVLQNHHRDWSAEVAGTGTKPKPLAYNFMGVPLEPGKQQVNLSFISLYVLWFQLGILLMGLGMFFFWRYLVDLAEEPDAV